MEEQNEQPRYVLGKRQENGRYPVAVDGNPPGGTVHRRHGSWFSVIPGQIQGGPFADRYQAAAHVVEMHDLGMRPRVPAPQLTLMPTPTSTYSHLLPDLRLSLANLVRAVEAMARLAQLGWAPLEGYPGADQPWLMQCRLCGWKGRRFWSHLRGRNGDRIPRPIKRHRGCIPVPDMPAALITLAAERTRTCRCDGQHPTTADTATAVVNVLGTALEVGATDRAVRDARAILEPCPASTVRALEIRKAYDRRVKAVSS
ncbi:hypothetical protein ABZX93_35225 [Streptomyces sp. NPDC006632]|uniref:hypothetical protein n=1 Tax=Streptomyces sp. NPDC006632 TaxID=3157182 RepID=UPI0033B02E54